MDTKLLGGDNYYTAILVSKKYNIIHYENLALSQLAYDMNLAKSIGIFNPTLEKMAAFATFNTASFAVIETENQRIAVAAAYPNWQYMTEPVKYF